VFLLTPFNSLPALKGHASKICNPIRTGLFRTLPGPIRVKALNNIIQSKFNSFYILFPIFVVYTAQIDLVEEF